MNGSDPPCSSAASTAVRTAPRYAAKLCPLSAKSSYSLYRESATRLASASARAAFLHAATRGGQRVSRGEK